MYESPRLMYAFSRPPYDSPRPPYDSPRPAYEDSTAERQVWCHLIIKKVNCCVYGLTALNAMDVISDPRSKRDKRCPKSPVRPSCNPRQDVADTLSNYTRRKTSAAARRCAIPTPDMEFGLHSMAKTDLRTALLHQIHLHRVNAPVDFTASPELRGQNLEMYQNYRLAAVSWCACVIPSCTLVDMHTLTSSAVELLDRYVARSLETGISLRDTLKDVRATRAACLLLSCNIHAVFHSVFAQSVCRKQDWSAKARVAEDCESHDNGKPFTEQDVIRKQIAITVTLRGSLFPTYAGNVARVLCKYMLLEYMTLTKRGDVFGTEPCLRKCRDVVTIEQLVRRSAVELYTRRTLSVELLKHKPVRCIAACCLLAMTKMLKITPVNQTTLRRSTIHLLLEMNCGGTSEHEFEDMTRLLTTECVVCSGGFTTWGVEKSLRALSASCCYDCERKLKEN